MLIRKLIFLLFSLLLISSCIGDDLIQDEVEPEIRFHNLIDTLEVGTTYQFEATFLNNIGQEQLVDFDWTSSASDVISVSSDGLALAIKPGQVTISARAIVSSITYEEQFELIAGQSTSLVEIGARSGVIKSTSSYKLEGNFRLSLQDDERLNLSIAEDYEATSALPGLYIYLSNNPNSISGAYEIGEVKVFSGAHEYIINDVDIAEYNYLLYYCKPFNVKVGEGLIENE